MKNKGGVYNIVRIGHDLMILYRGVDWITGNIPIFYFGILIYLHCQQIKWEGSNVWALYMYKCTMIWKDEKIHKYGYIYNHTSVVKLSFM